MVGNEGVLKWMRQMHNWKKRGRVGSGCRGKEPGVRSKWKSFCCFEGRQMVNGDEIGEEILMRGNVVVGVIEVY